MSLKASKRTNAAESFDREWARWHVEHGAEEKPPVGSITAEAYAKIAKCGYGPAACLLGRKAATGALKTGLFRIRSKDGFLRKVRHWWKA